MRALPEGTRAAPAKTGSVTRTGTTALSLSEEIRQRFDEFSRSQKDVGQYIAGAGGATVYAVDEDDPQLAWGVSGLFGALRIVLEPGLATFEFRDSRGRLLDRSRRRCST